MVSGCCLLSTLPLQLFVGACPLMLQADAGKGPLTSLLLWAARAWGAGARNWASLSVEGLLVLSSAVFNRNEHASVLCTVQVAAQLQSSEMASCRSLHWSLQVQLLLQWSKLMQVAAQLQSSEMASCRSLHWSLQVQLLLQWSKLMLLAACVLPSTCPHQKLCCFHHEVCCNSTCLSRSLASASSVLMRCSMSLLPASV